MYDFDQPVEEIKNQDKLYQQYKRIVRDVQKHVDETANSRIARKAVAKISAAEFVKMKFPNQFKGLPALALDIIEKISG